MTKLIMMRGLPASGKSTKSRELMQNYGNFFRVNKDDLRKMMLEGKWNFNKEKIVKEMEYQIVDQLLYNEKNVIVDDTNLTDKDLTRWKDLVIGWNGKFEIIEMKLSLFDCIQRDNQRVDKVGENVIWRMALRNKLWIPKKKIIICDIDGTIANIDHRLHYVKKDKPDWKGFFSEIHNDTLRFDIWEQVQEEVKKNNADLFFVSGRSDEYREETKNFLKHYGIKDYVGLLMRPKDSFIKDTEIKQEILNMFGKENIIKVFDDRPSVIRMWRENGLDVIDVGDGKDF